MCKLKTCQVCLGLLKLQFYKRKSQLKPDLRPSCMNVHLSSFKNPIDFPDNSQISFAAIFAPKPQEANECLVDGCGPVMERSSSEYSIWVHSSVVRAADCRSAGLLSRPAFWLLRNKES